MFCQWGWPKKKCWRSNKYLLIMLYLASNSKVWQGKRKDGNISNSFGKRDVTVLKIQIHRHHANAMQDVSSQDSKIL